MSYDFSFSKKTISFALGGFAFVGILLFVAGLLIGTSWKAEPAPAVAVVAKQPAPAPPAPEPPAPQQQPIVRADVAKPEAAVPSEADASSVASAPVRQSHGNAASLNSKRWQSLLPVLPATANDGELKIIQEAEPSVNEAAETTDFSVQVGVFVSETDAHQLVRQLQKKGYTPIVLAASDEGSKLWYSVRIGAYKNRTEAAQAASNIAGQEQLKAVVRPLGSL
jgi:cell division septation protein DedD